MAHNLAVMEINKYNDHLHSFYTIYDKQRGLGVSNCGSVLFDPISYYSKQSAITGSQQYHKWYCNIEIGYYEQSEHYTTIMIIIPKSKYKHSAKKN